MQRGPHGIEIFIFCADDSKKLVTVWAKYLNALV